MTKAALDSAFPPSDAQIAAAKAAGYVAWFGYFKFGNDGIYNGWADSDFQRVKAGGLQTMAYCSGWANPGQVSARASSLLIRTCLDVEGGIRPDGNWVQGWLDAAGSGLYGNYWIHPGRKAPFHVLAAYPTLGDPGDASWWGQTPRPAGLCAWQWAGSHAFAGITVDSSWLDDGFFAFSAAGDQLIPAISEEEGSMLFWRKSDNTYWIVDASGKRQQPFDEAKAFAQPFADKGLPTPYHTLGDESILNAQFIPDAIRAAAAGADLSAVLTAIADLKAHPVVASDPVLLGKVTSIEANLNAPRPPA